MRNNPDAPVTEAENKNKTHHSCMSKLESDGADRLT